MFTVMGGTKILIGSEGNETSRIDVLMSHIIMPFDVIHIHRVGHAVKLIEIFEIAEQMGIIDNSSDVALEMSMIHGVEPDERHEQPPICLHRVLAEEIPLSG
jgi:hypothetical protein